MPLPAERRAMTYYQFVQAVEEKVKEGIGKDVCVSIYTAQKYNGTLRKGILFSEQGSNISPAIYLEEYYRQFERGDSLEFIVREILLLYGKLRFREPWKEELLKNYEGLKDRLIYRLINRKANEELLREMPYVPYLDLAIVFYVLLDADVCGMAAMPVKEENLKLWNATKEQVYEEACRNTQRLLPCEFQTMRSVISELTDKEAPEGEDVLYVLGNRLRSFGAAAILYPGRLEEIGEYLGENYYVLPSSVHETIVVRESAAPGKAFLRAMVTEINETQVDEEEVLSNGAYYYDRAHRRLCM